MLHDDDLLGADEAFLTSTTREIVPIVRVDDRTHRHRQARRRDAARCWTPSAARLMSLRGFDRWN